MLNFNHVYAALSSSSSSSSTQLKGTLHSQFSLDNLLLAAAQNGQEKRVLALIKLGANPDHDSPRRKMAAVQMLAASGVITKDNIDTLIDNGLDIKRKDRLQRNILFLLMAGNTNEYIETFLTLFWDYGLDIAARDKHKNTLFHVAATHETAQWMRILLGVFRVRYSPKARHEFINLKNNKGKTAHDIATERKNNAIADLLQAEMTIINNEIEKEDKKITDAQEKLREQREEAIKNNNLIIDMSQFMFTQGDDSDDDNLIPNADRLREIYQTAWDPTSSAPASVSSSHLTQEQKKKNRKSWHQ
jgi:ankyrin repeat protein